MIDADKALDIILNSVSPLSKIRISIERARGYVLAEEIVASEHVPSFDNSGMDGYAVRSADLKNVPSIVEIVGEVAAGSLSTKSIGHGEAISIMTGAKIPAGADAVVQVEWTEIVDDRRVRVNRSVPAGHNIRRAGADIMKDSRALQSGQLLRPQEIGILASLGRRFAEVYRRPSVGILTTGNEIVSIDQPISEGKVRNSNAYSLMALVDEFGGEPIDLGISGDDRTELLTKINRVQNTDILITSGGVSAGKYDLVVGVLRELGADIKFWKVNIKPGMPMLFALLKDKPVFALPGNPVSTMVTCLRFVKPALMKMAGHRTVKQEFTLHAKIEHELKKSDGKRHFIRGFLGQINGALVVRSTGSQASNALSSLTKANCLIIIPEKIDHIRAGEYVEVELL